MQQIVYPVNDLQNISLQAYGLGKSNNQRKREPKIKRKIKIQKQKKQVADDDDDADIVPPNSSVPGSQKIYVKTFGCAHNISDSQFMMGLLADYGYQLIGTVENSDLVLINSCTVKNPSQDAFIQMIGNSHKAKKPIVVAGCVPQGDSSLKDITNISVVGIAQIDRVVQVVQQTLKGNTVKLLQKNRLPSLDLPKKCIILIRLPINSGCLGACTYCKTVHARGKLNSYTKQALVQRVKTVISQGVKQIWMSSQDTGAYGLDIGQNITSLLHAIIKILPADVMLRIGMTNPPYMERYLDGIALALNHPQVYSFIHIPVQAGNDRVLTAMNRQYFVNDFKKVSNFLLDKVPGLTVATDIICGFPGQTDQQFQDTMKLIQDYKFRMINISQFYPRPGTPAAKMQRTPTKKVKQRSGKVSALFRSFSNRHTYLIGTIQRVSINQYQIIKQVKQLIGHTKNYTKKLLGTHVLMRITQAFAWHVQGKIIQQNMAIQMKKEYKPNLNQIKKNQINESRPLWILFVSLVFIIIGYMMI